MKLHSKFIYKTKRILILLVSITPNLWQRLGRSLPKLNIKQTNRCNFIFILVFPLKRIS